MKRLTKKQMWIFAIGQLGWSTLSGIISAWLVTFYLPTQSDIEGGALQYIKPGLIIGGFLTILGLLFSGEIEDIFKIFLKNYCIL